MVGNMKNALLFFVLFLVGSASGQVSILGGGSMLVGFGSGKPWGGIHVGVEIPKSDAVSFYARYTYHFRNTERDSTLYDIEVTDPEFGFVSVINTNGVTKMDYHIIEGGTRYYIVNGFDYGWGAYGGASVMLMFNSVKVVFGDPQFRNNTSRNGTVFSVGVGVGGGVKYSLARFGTIYLDGSVNYKILNQASQQYVSGELFSNLIFNFNLGIRKDIIW